MNKKTISLILLSTLLIAMYVPIAVAHNAPFPATYDATTAIVDTIGEPETVDPAWGYDTASGGIIFNVYETMTFFDNVMEGNGPYTAGKVDQFKPLLATTWAWMAGPAPYVKTITFTIRPFTTFHDGNVLTAADVEYSWERWMVQDRDGGPAWMFYYPVLGLYGAVDPATDPNFGNEINNAITSGAGTVSIHLLTNYDETRFLQIMSGPWASVVEKAWAVARGDFDGNWAAGWAAIYANWHNPAASFIEGDMMGTGPYKFDLWVRGTTWSILKYDNYWDGWPARVRRAPPAGERIGGFLTKVTWNLLTSWTTRRARFLAGDSDFTYVPRQSRDDVLGQVVGGELIRSYYPIPQLALDSFFFNFNINPLSPYLGPGFDPAHPFIIAFDRIPINLFSDINMRRAFANVFDYNSYLTSAYLGEAGQPADPVISGLSYNNPANVPPVFNMPNAVANLQAAWGGQVWINGMSFAVAFNSGDLARKQAAKMLVQNINSLKDVWDVGESAVSDDNDNGVYDAGDTILAGGVPPIGTILCRIVGSDKYADLDADNTWDVGESAVRDVNNNGIFDAGDIILSGGVVPGGTILRFPGSQQLFADLNGLFRLTWQELPWVGLYLPQMKAGMLPIFAGGWTADYADPDDFVFAFMHSQGTFSKFQSYSNARVDALIEAGALTPDDIAPYAGQLDQPDLASLNAVFNNPGGIPPDFRWPRRSIYYELQAIYRDDVPGFCLAQPAGRHWEQPWMRGWYYNPLYGGSLASAADSAAPEAPVTYFYHIWKALTHFGDANNDGIVNVLDAAAVSASFTKPSPTSPVGPVGYRTQCDLGGGTGGTPDGGTGLVLGMPDGRVTVVDGAIVSAYWDGPPKGPQHP